MLQVAPAAQPFSALVAVAVLLSSSLHRVTVVHSVRQSHSNTLHGSLNIFVCQDFIYVSVCNRSLCKPCSLCDSNPL